MSIVRIVLFLLWAAPAAAQQTHESCTSCHAEQVEAFQTHPHAAKNLSCDICHGESAKHRDSNGAVAPDRVSGPKEIPGLCGSCHSGPRKEWEASKHAQALLANATAKTAHCGNCHGVHGRKAAKVVEQQCVRCHANRPEVCRKDPPSATASVSCITCHSRHSLAAKR